MTSEESEISDIENRIINYEKEQRTIEKTKKLKMTEVIDPKS